MEYETVKNRHLSNISRQVGHNVDSKYSYIVTENDLINAYTQMRNELKYPLMVDSKNRRAIVYNKKGIEKQIRENIINNIVENIEMIDRMIVEDIMNQLNGLVQTANGTFVLGKNSGVSNGTLSMFVNAMTKGLVQGVGSIVDDIINPKDNHK